MPSLGFLLDQRNRFCAALTRFDPLYGDPLTEWLDPTPTKPKASSKSCGLPYARVSLVWCAVVLPEVAFSLAPSTTLGGGFFGQLGMSRDVMLWFQFLLMALWLILALWIRRVLGDLVNEFEASGICRLPPNLNSLPQSSHAGIRLLERLSRLTPRRAIAWATFLIVLNLLQLPGAMRDGRQTWITSQWQPGSLLSPFHIGNEQLNLAGVWHMGVLSAFMGYQQLIIVRLYVSFTYLSQLMSDDDSLNIVPDHPDKTGGLLPAGQASLALSLFSLSAGLWLTGLTSYVHLVLKTPPSFMFYTLWSIYLIVGPLLFFLPLAPLRRAMIRAKRNYLSGAEALYARAEQQHRMDIESGTFDPAALQGHASLAALLEHASDMAVWPLDRVTFRRFAGMLVSPLVPVIAEQFWPTVTKVLPFLRSG
jgi:hypothetical protein